MSAVVSGYVLANLFNLCGLGTSPSGPVDSGQDIGHSCDWPKWTPHGRASQI